MDRPIGHEWLELFNPDDPDPDLLDRETPARAIAGSDALREQLSAIRATDARIGAAVCDVSVPENLKDRLRDRLFADQRVRRRRHLRRVAFAGLASAVAAGLIFLLLWTPNTREPMTLEALSLEAMDQYRTLPDLSEEPSDWGDGSDWPAGFRSELCTGCRLVPFLGGQVRAYQFHSKPAGRWALLLMVPIEQFPADLQPHGSYSTMGLSTVLSLRGNFVCVAVVVREDDLWLFQDRVPIT